MVRHSYLCVCALLNDRPLKDMYYEGYVLCSLFKTLSSFVLFRFLNSLVIMHIILTVENVIKLKWNIYTVPFAEDFRPGKWMCVSDILQHMRMWFIDFWWLCWHQCIYLKSHAAFINTNGKGLSIFFFHGNSSYICNNSGSS